MCGKLFGFNRASCEIELSREILDGIDSIDDMERPAKKAGAHTHTCISVAYHLGSLAFFFNPKERYITQVSNMYSCEEGHASSQVIRM